MYKVLVYMISNNTHEFKTENLTHAREYAKRMTTEGVWIEEPIGLGDATAQVFYPVHQIYKVKIFPADV